MKLQEFCKGIEVLLPYYEGNSGYCLGAEHDIIYFYQTNLPMKPEDVARMRELGWFQEGSDEKEYDPENGWACFV